jgi:pyruvate, orthophosphate dikinase
MSTPTISSAMDTPIDASIRWVMPFADGDASMRELLGGKGANLAEMARIGLPVPPGFIVTTAACREFRATGEVPAGLFDQVDAALADLEAATGRRLDDASAPLLLSVRSGAVFSMPGMMDTVLDLGATDTTVPGLIAMGDEAFAWDATRRFTELFGRVVLGVESHVFDTVLTDAIAVAGVRDERELSGAQLADVVARQRAAVEQRGITFPSDPREQLRLAITAVFRSWDGARAKAYRRVEGIDDDLGTAVNVQMMVFGNLDERSATGVAFTRDPATGERVPVRRLPRQRAGRGRGRRHTASGAARAPRRASSRAARRTARAPRHAGTARARPVRHRVHDRVGKLWMLQTRVGKRSAAAALRMAVEMVDEGLIDGGRGAQAVMNPTQLEQLLHPRFSPDAPDALTTGLAASPGAAVGERRPERPRRPSTSAAEGIGRRARARGDVTG